MATVGAVLGFELDTSRVKNNILPRKPQVNKAPLNERMVGVSRQLDFKLRVGGYLSHKLQAWSKSEMAYCAGSNASATIPIQKGFDIFKLYQDYIKEHKKPLPFAILTSMALDGVVEYTDAPEFSGVVTTVRMNRRAGVYVLTAASYAQVLQFEKVNEILATGANSRKTTSQVVKEYTQKFGQGLKTVDKDGKSTVHDFKTTIGQVYKQQAVQQAVNMPVWDLFMSFAAKDNADLYVEGDVLYYQPKPVDLSPNVTSLEGTEANYTYKWGYNILDLEIEHSPLFSHEVSVTVKSVQLLTQQTYTSTATMNDAKVKAMAEQLEKNPNTLAPTFDRSQKKMAKHQKPGQSRVVTSGALSSPRIGNKENYTYVIQNGSQEDCDRISAQIAKDISRKEFLVTLTVLAQPNFSHRQYIRLQNTGSEAADQVYAVKAFEVSWTMPDSGDSTEGYIARFTLVNHAVQTSGASLGV
jgi:hypothetical protein